MTSKRTFSVGFSGKQLGKLLNRETRRGDGATGWTGNGERSQSGASFRASGPARSPLFLPVFTINDPRVFVPLSCSFFRDSTRDPILHWRPFLLVISPRWIFHSPPGEHRFNRHCRSLLLLSSPLLSPVLLSRTKPALFSPRVHGSFRR